MLVKPSVAKEVIVQSLTTVRVKVEVIEFRAPVRGFGGMVVVAVIS